MIDWAETEQGGLRDFLRSWTRRAQRVKAVATAFVSRNRMQTGKEPVKVSLRLAPLDL